jgi:hypothetical protein
MRWARRRSLSKPLKATTWFWWTKAIAGTGTAAGAWMSRRDALVRGGFAFEYSATFGQAVAKGLTVAAAEEDMQKKRAKMLFETSSLKKLTAFELARLALDHRRQAPCP